MPTSSRPDLAGSAGIKFSYKERNGKIISYMWYIHILVKVNTEDRLRDHIAPLLQSDVPSCVSSPSLPCAGSSDEHDSMHGGGGKKMEKVDDLTDYLVLHFFNNKVLGQLVDTAPLLEQAEAYARVLAGVPESFREEFCRRLYVLLFRYNIVEWPPGISVPDPAAAAAIAVAAGASPPHPGQRDPEPSDPLGNDDEMAGSEEDRGRRRRYPGRDSSVSSATTASPSPSPSSSPSPSPDGSEHGSEMAREAYFGTASSPLPWNYFSDWHLSRNGYGPLPEYAEYDVADNGSSQRQPAPPHTTPQQQQQQMYQMQQQQQRERAVSPRCHFPKIPYAEDPRDDIFMASAYPWLSRVDPHHLHRSSGDAVGCGYGGGGAVRVRQVSGQGGNRLSGPDFSPVPGADLASDCALAVEEDHHTLGYLGLGLGSKCLLTGGGPSRSDNSSGGVATGPEGFLLLAPTVDR